MSASPFQAKPLGDRRLQLSSSSVASAHRAIPLLGRRTDFLNSFIPSSYVDDEGTEGVEYPYIPDEEIEVSKRSRRHNEDSEEARLLSPSAFSRISETLGALNTVGSFLVNFTRGENSHHHQNTHNGNQNSYLNNHGSNSHGSNSHRIDQLQLQGEDDDTPEMELISSSGSSDTSISSVPAASVPDAILTLTKNVLGQNMTKTIEPLIKRVGINASPEKQDFSAISEKIDMASLAEKKRKKHQTETTKAVAITHPTVEPGKILKMGGLAHIRSFDYILKSLLSSIYLAKIEDLDGKEGENRCITPNGLPGRCEDLSVCPGLLLDLSGLRDSLCFKRLFIPGVCCPLDPDASTILTTQRPAFLTQR